MTTDRAQPIQPAERSHEQSGAKSGLLSYETLEEKLSGELKRIHEVARPIFFFKVLELAEQKTRREAARDKYDNQAPELRKSIRLHRKMITQLSKAINNLTAAERIAQEEDEELMKNLDVVECKRLLTMAKADLEWVASDFLPGIIHPKRRKRGESPNLRLPRYEKENLIGLGVYEVDRWFIGELDQALDQLPKSDSRRSRIGKDRIIKKVFELTVSEPYGLERIKNARITMARKRRVLRTR